MRTMSNSSKSGLVLGLVLSVVLLVAMLDNRSALEVAVGVKSDINWGEAPERAVYVLNRDSTMWLIEGVGVVFDQQLLNDACDPNTTFSPAELDTIFWDFCGGGHIFIGAHIVNGPGTFGPSVESSWKEICDLVGVASLAGYNIIPVEVPPWIVVKYFQDLGSVARGKQLRPVDNLWAVDRGPQE